MSTTSTLAPSSWSRRAGAAPIPRPAPLPTNALPSRPGSAIRPSLVRRLTEPTLVCADNTVRPAVHDGLRLEAQDRVAGVVGELALPDDDAAPVVAQMLLDDLDPAAERRSGP